VLLLPLPLIGPVLRASLVSRWLDAVRVGVQAGLDLPAALSLAGDATGSPGLVRDGRAMSESLTAGRALTSTDTVLLPPTVPAAIEFASGHNDLPTTLETLTELYQRQAELRLESVPTVLTPLLLIFMAVTVGVILAGLFMPLVSIIQAMTS
jgi:type IV pilus assembly protein PilC